MRGIKNAFIVIIICFIVALVVFTQVLGAPENFEGGDPAGGQERVIQNMLRYSGNEDGYGRLYAISVPKGQ